MASGLGYALNGQRATTIFVSYDAGLAQRIAYHMRLPRRAYTHKFGGGHSFK